MGTRAIGYADIPALNACSVCGSPSKVQLVRPPVTPSYSNQTKPTTSGCFGSQESMAAVQGALYLFGCPPVSVISIGFWLNRRISFIVGSSSCSVVCSVTSYAVTPTQSTYASPG